MFFRHQGSGPERGSPIADDVDVASATESQALFLSAATLASAGQVAVPPVSLIFVPLGGT
jgi:hypothetical protein